MVKQNEIPQNESLLRDLETNMNEEFRATLQYICHRIAAKGEHTSLAESFKSAALDEMSHILFFSDLITKYGGTPRFADWDIDKSTDIKTMLQKDIALEQAARQRYSAQLQRLKDNRSVAAVIQSVLDDEEDHESRFEAYLKKLP